MYISGALYDFESRLHQLPSGQADLNSFITEGTAYKNLLKTGTSTSGVYTSGILQSWNREFARRSFSLSGNTSYYLTGAITY